MLNYNKKMVFFRKYINTPYVKLFILIVLTGLILYGKFIFGDYIFAYGDWGYDTLHSYLPAYEFYSQKIADFRMGNFDFSYGLGTSIFANISFLTDPFGAIIIFLGVLFGSDNIGFFLIYMHFVKNIIIGLLGIYYLKMFKFSDDVCIISSYVLSFCGCVMIMGQHYYFATYAVVFMFAIIMCERMLRNSKCWMGLLLGVAWLGIISPFALFQGLICIGIYCFFRVIQLYKVAGIKKIIRKFFEIAGVILLGIVVSMFVFLPQCYEILIVSERLAGESTILQQIINSFRLLPVGHIQTEFMRLFSNNLQGLINTWEGPGTYFSAPPYFFSLFFPICIVQEVVKVFDKIWTKKERIIRLVIIGLMVFLFTNRFFPLISNMFAYVQYRFGFVLLPFFAFCFAEIMEDLVYKRRFSSFSCVCSSMFFTTILIIVFKSENKYSILSLRETLGILWLITILTIMLKYFKKPTANRVTKNILYVIIIFSVIFDSAIGLYAEHYPERKDMYKIAYHMPYFQEFKFIIDQNKNEFFRVERTFTGYDGSPDVMFASIYPIRSTSVYNSTLSKYTIEYLRKINRRNVVSQAAYALNSYGTWFDPHTADLLGIKYVISYSGNEHLGWEKVADYDGIYLYQNKNFESAGLVYSNYITEDKYEQLDIESKASVTSQAVILENMIDSIEEKDLFEYEKVIDGCMLSERIEGMQEIDLAIVDMGTKNYFLKVTGICNGKVELRNESEEILNTEEIKLNENSQEFIIQISPEITKAVVISNDDICDIQSAELFSTNLNYCQSVYFFNSNMGNIVEGKIVIENRKILYMPIPYDFNWTAYINGEKVEILKANYGFMGIELSEGINEIKFIYHNYSLIIGLIISGIGLAITISLVLWQKKAYTK